jgi:hypothetical protein
MVLKVWQSWLWAVGLTAGAMLTPAGAQNIDAGKTPAQLYASSCGVCHRSPGELRATGKATPAFLRQHYTTSREEAAAMAAYVRSGPISESASRAPATQRRPATSASAPPEPEPASRSRRPPRIDQARTTDEPAAVPNRQRKPPKASETAKPSPAEKEVASAPADPPAPVADVDRPVTPARRTSEMLLPEDTPPLPAATPRVLLPEETMSPTVESRTTPAQPFEE